MELTPCRDICTYSMVTKFGEKIRGLKFFDENLRGMKIFCGKIRGRKFWGK